MGCDIHSHAEKQDGAHWRHLDGEPFEDRNYALFGWLADVRNYSAVVPIAAGRGVPSDASEQTQADYENWSGDAHSASWVGVGELLAIDYEQAVEDRRTTKQLAPNWWTGGATCEPGEGKTETLRSFLGAGYFFALERLRSSGADRVVFWFDN